jgi:hypothetical protein
MHMNKQSGEVVLGLLVGLAIGAVMLWINAGNYAQEVANQTGQPVSTYQYIEDEPGVSAITVLLPAAAGAGVGWLIEEAGGGSKGSRSGSSANVNITGENNVVNIRGDEEGDVSQNTSTSY